MSHHDLVSQKTWEVTDTTFVHLVMTDKDCKMPENTPFDFVWLGLLIGVYDLGNTTRGMEQLRNQLEYLGLTATLAKLPDIDDAEDADIESDTIGHWVGEELREKGINSFRG